MTSEEINVIAVGDRETLREHIPKWTELAREASEANPFYEHWMLLPAWEHLGEAENLEVLLVYRGESLIALFPVQEIAKFRGIPLSHYRLWFHRHCYLGSPLIQLGEERAALEALFHWLKTKHKALLSWNWVGGEGAIFEAFDKLVREGRWSIYQSGYERAVLRGRVGGEGYVNATISGKHRRDYARLEKRLSEIGELNYRVAGTEAEVKTWLESFFELEASGWKGREGTAMKCDAGDRAFMIEIVHSAFLLGKARLSSLSVGDRAIAAKCEFIVNRSCFGFKVGFDEKYAKSRPGLLLEIWLLRQMDRLDCDFFDSCSQPGSMFERIWADRRKIASIAVATRVFPEGALLRAIPYAKDLLEKLQSFKLRPRPTPAPSSADPASDAS